MEHKIGLNQSGQTIFIPRGDTISIELEENPTTGFLWAIEEADSIFSITQNNYQLQNDAMGGGGIRTIKFKSLGAGEGKIRLKNWQRWSGEVDRRFEVLIKSSS